MIAPVRLREAMRLGGMSPRELAVRTWARSNEHEIMTRASAVSFYAMLALVPFLALVMTVTARVLPDLTGQGSASTGIGNLTTDELRTTLRAFLPKEAYDVFADQITRLQSLSRPPLLLLAASTAVTLWLASSLFVAIIDALNRIYGVTETRSFVRLRLTAITMTCIQAAILVFSLLAIVLWPQITRWMGLDVFTTAIVTAVQWALTLLMVLTSFALTFYVGPDADQKWEWITPGSLFGSFVFLATCFGFRIYVQQFANYNQTYGSLGGVMVLLFWFWISSLVLLGAAQMNFLIEEASPLGKRYGQKVDPTDAPDLKAMPPEEATSPATQ